MLAFVRYPRRVDVASGQAVCVRCAAVAIEGICLRCLCAADPAPIEIPGFVLMDEIGRGGSATVYAARRLADDRVVAIKVFAAGLDHDAATLVRFEREAALLQSLRHPNILAIEGWGEVNDRHYLVTELAEGGPISERIPVEPAMAGEIVQQVCAALSFAHERQIVHRDVKPQNVLIGADGSIKLGDFGTARRIQAETQPLTETGGVVGTPYYIAPEAMHGAPHDPRMDIYAAGVLLYHLVTGTLPIGYFEALPGALDPIVRRALAHNPERRYATIDELRADLRRLGAGSGPPSTRPSRRWRRPVVAIATGLAVAAIAWQPWAGRDADRATIDAPAVEPTVPQTPRTKVTMTAPIPASAAPIGAPPRQRSRTSDREANDTATDSSSAGVTDGTVVIIVRPWAEVQIDGVARGRAEPPTSRFRAPPGAHTIVLSHPITGVTTTRRVTVESGREIEIQADLSRASTSPPP